MYRAVNPDEDLLLKQVITDRFTIPATDRAYSWREVLTQEKRKPITDIIVTRGAEDTHFSLEDVADAIGESLADLLISRQADEKSIFSDVNRKFVADVAHAVANSLTKSLDEGGRLRLSEADLYLLIEKALLENEAYDVAKSLAFRRSMEKTGGSKKQSQIVVTPPLSDSIATSIERRWSSRSGICGPISSG